MSYQIKNVTFKDGFAKNPDKYYCEEFFNQLPLSTGEFQVSASAGTTSFSIFQPANTFIKSLNVVCHTAVAMTSGNLGVTIGTTSGGSQIVSSNNNLINSGTALAANTVSALSFVDTTNYTTSGRILHCRAISSADASAVGKLFLVAEFVTLSSSRYNGPDNYAIIGTHGHIPSYDNSSGYSGVKITTAAVQNDQAILFPNLLEDNSISKGVFKTGSELEFETSVIFPVVSDTPDYSFVAGLKLTGTPLVATDATQAMFIYGNDTPLVASNSLASNTNLCFVYSIGGDDYITNLGLPIVGNRVYHLKIKMNKQRKLCVYVNGVQFGLTTTVTADSSSMGSLATNTYDESSAITNDIALFPIVGLQISSTNSRSLVVNYIKYSRNVKRVS